MAWKSSMKAGNNGKCQTWGRTFSMICWEEMPGCSVSKITPKQHPVNLIIINGDDERLIVVISKLKYLKN